MTEEMKIKYSPIEKNSLIEFQRIDYKKMIMKYNPAGKRDIGRPCKRWLDDNDRDKWYHLILKWLRSRRRRSFSNTGWAMSNWWFSTFNKLVNMTNKWTREISWARPMFAIVVKMAQWIAEILLLWRKLKKMVTQLWFRRHFNVRREIDLNTIWFQQEESTVHTNMPLL